MKDVITLHINGDEVEVGVPTHFTLLETLRYVLGLTGSKQGCDKGDCGACTVLLDGKPHLACIMPVYEAIGRRITTVEGLAEGRVPPPPPGCLRSLRRSSVRLLHARNPVQRLRAAGRERRSEPR